MSGVVSVGGGAGGGEAGLEAFSASVAAAAVAYFADGEPGVGILKELSCGNATGYCGGGDGTGRQFKGAFVRHLGYAAQLAGPSSEYFQWAMDFLGAQSASLLANASIPVGSGGLQFGQLWQGPYMSDLSPWVSQGCALDAMLAYSSLAAIAAADAR